MKHEMMHQMKRILIFSLAYYPHVGGAEVALKEITDRISDIEFHMLTLNFGADAKEEKIGNVFVHRIGPPAGGGTSYFSKILFIPRAALSARTLHRAHHFDACWAMMSYMLFPIVLLRCMGLRNPYVLTLQEGDPWQHMFNRWFILPFRPLLSIGFKNASAVQAISAYLAQWAKKMGYRGEISIIPNGVDGARFSNVRPPRSNLTTLVTTSRLVHKNAIDEVISALKFLPDTVHFRICGEGPDEKELKHLAHTLGVESRVEFMGHVDHLELPHILSECNIFIRPSRSEGMGNSFIEAMAAGLPVVATQEGGIADFLFDAKRNPDKETTGWAVDKDSPEQIAEVVQDILRNPEQVARVTANAKKLVTEKYDWDFISKKMKGLFDTIGTI